MHNINYIIVNNYFQIFGVASGDEASLPVDENGNMEDDEDEDEDDEDLEVLEVKRSGQGLASSMDVEVGSARQSKVRLSLSFTHKKWKSIYFHKNIMK